MQLNTTLADIKQLKTNYRLLANGVGKLLNFVAVLMQHNKVLAHTCKQWEQKYQAEHDEKVMLAKQLAEIQAVLADQIVDEAKTELVISTKKPRKQTTRKSTRKPKTMAVMEETAALLSVHLPEVSEEELAEEF